MSCWIAPLLTSLVLNGATGKTFGLPSIRISVTGSRSVAAVFSREVTALGNWMLGTLDRSPTTIVSGTLAPDRQVPASGFLGATDADEQPETAASTRPRQARAASGPRTAPIWTMGSRVRGMVYLRYACGFGLPARGDPASLSPRGTRRWPTRPRSSWRAAGGPASSAHRPACPAPRWSSRGPRWQRAPGGPRRRAPPRRRRDRARRPPAACWRTHERALSWRT